MREKLIELLFGCVSENLTLKQNSIDRLTMEIHPVLLLVLGLGFFTAYALAWVGLGIPAGWWASLTVTVLTIASEYGFIKWMEG